MVRNYLVIAVPPVSGKAAPASKLGGFTIAEKSTVQGQSRDYMQCCLAGTTAQRPMPGDNDMPALGAPAGVPYYDTTLTYVIFSDGAGGWRNPANGNLV